MSITFCFRYVDNPFNMRNWYPLDMFVRGFVSFFSSSSRWLQADGANISSQRVSSRQAFANLKK